ncbi:MAG TPA: glycosyltransferase family 39 protein [Flavisolibacter sp.]|nr:glycosyltransferase family 39 protein [Flavisolibacter sp.]
MKELFQKHHRIIFYAGWFLLGLVQCLFTELQDDEAYYWVFSKYLDWGYFDHPPMIALLVKMGVFLSGELGVRFFSLLLNTATIFITEKLTERKDAPLFYAIVLSVAVLQVGGFMAVPDTPLMFFTALFFLTYKNYLQQASWKNALLLGLVAACLLYSKYHAVLLFLFIVLSNWKLLKDIKVYAAGIFALLLFVPHLYWQSQHHWISFRYHLFESNVNPYKFSYTTDYILGQLLIAGPFIGFLLWPVAFLYRSNNSFERSLVFTAVGMFAFFFLSTFKGKVEPNWTSPAIVPLLVLAHQYVLKTGRWRRWIFRFLPITLLFVVALRVVMIVDILPVQAITERYHGWNGWQQQLKQQTGGLPVVINNSYQRASKYAFYSGVTTYSLNKFNERRNNYNFWPIEDSLLGKPVYVMDIFGLERFQKRIETPLYTVGFSYDSSYHSFAKIMFKAEEQKATISDSLTINFTLDVPALYKTYLAQHPEVDQAIALAFFEGQTMVKQIDLPFTLQDLLNKNITSLRVFPGLGKGDYFMRFGIMSDSGLFTHNSEKIKLTVTE